MSSASPSVPVRWAGALAQVRAAARARAEALGPPTTALEDWRYVQLGPLAQAVPGTPRSVRAAELGVHALAPARLVVLDGSFRPDLSDLARLPPELQVQDLLGLDQGSGEALAATWQARTQASTDPVVAQTLAGMRGGVVLRWRATTPPVHLILAATGGESAGSVTVVVERGVTAALALTTLQLGPSHHRCLLDLALEAGAQLDLRQRQRGPGAAGSLHLETATATLARDARLTWRAQRTGAALGRLRLEVDLGAAGAELDLATVAALDEQRQWHDLTRVTHQVGSTTSTQLVKAVADGRAAGSYDGLVAIRPGADGANALQRHQSLLLSAHARIDSRPQLDIAADDVKAAHGSSIGHLQPDELFYLRSRGIAEHEARDLLVRGFVAEVAGPLPEWL